MKNKKQYKVGDKVKYDGEECMVINIGIEDFGLVIVPMSVIDDECIGVELDELD
jgi:hypothetical protein